jgi:hypothetical protein
LSLLKSLTETHGIPVKMAPDTVPRHQARQLSQPHTKAQGVRVFGDETINVKWYCPPLDGNADANSARPRAEIAYRISVLQAIEGTQAY